MRGLLDELQEKLPLLLNSYGEGRFDVHGQSLSALMSKSTQQQVLWALVGGGMQWVSLSAPIRFLVLFLHLYSSDGMEAWRARLGALETALTLLHATVPSIAALQRLHCMGQLYKLAHGLFHEGQKRVLINSKDKIAEVWRVLQEVGKRSMEKLLMEALQFVMWVYTPG